MHDANDPESSLHSKVEPASLELNANDALVEVVDQLGPEPMVVVGSVVSVGVEPPAAW